MNYIDVINKYGKDIKEQNVMEKFINYCTLELKLKNVMFNVIIINDDEIHKLNKQYRNIDRATDVITFALEDYKEGPTLDIRVLGDIYISYDKVIKQAKDYGHSKTRELCFLAVHGLLHLCGYDHIEDDEAEEMEALEQEILQAWAHR